MDKSPNMEILEESSSISTEEKKDPAPKENKM
jgi:hypothetical protein